MFQHFKLLGLPLFMLIKLFLFLFASIKCLKFKGEKVTMFDFFKLVKLFEKKTISKFSTQKKLLKH